MPNVISLVVPVWGVQGYLDECLDSALAQTFADVEVIAVDDASSDHSAAVLDERAERDTRLTVIHLPENVGPGPARNAGLDRATGEYVWFLDGDDRLAPDALAEVAQRLRAAGDPDLLLVGTAKENFARVVERDQQRSPATTTELTPGIDTVSPTSLPIGALVIRREFLVASGVVFRPGWYEDISFYYEVFLAAATAATLAPTCYIRRVEREGGIRRSRSDRHVDLIDRYEHVLGLPAFAENARQRRRLFAVAASHILTVYGDEGRVAAEDRRRYLRRAAVFVHRHSDADVAGRAPLERFKQALAIRDAYRSYELARRVWALHKTTLWLLWRARTNVWAWLRRTFLLLYYWFQRRLPVDDTLVAYAAYWYRGYSCNPAAIYERAKTVAPHLRGVWIAWEPPADTQGRRYVVPDTRAYFRLVARARFFVNNVGFPPEVVKRPGQVHLQTHHGTPLKTMGFDQARYPASAPWMDYEEVRRICRTWDYSLTGNRHTTLLWERQFPTKGETLEYGYPRNDVLANATAEDVARARAELGLPPGRRVVLYAPTHREWHATFTPVVDIDAWAETLGPDTTLLLRAHYFYDATARRPRHPRIVDVSAHPSIEQLYLAADVLVTDYSSVMFDYAILDRPIVIFAPDWEIYQVVRGATFDVAAEAPGVFVQSFDELAEVFASGDVGGDRATKARQDFRERFCALDDGRAAERVVRRVFLGEPVAAGPRLESRTNG